MNDLDIKSIFDIFETTSEEDVDLVSDFNLDTNTFILNSIIVGLDSYKQLDNIYSKRYPEVYQDVNITIQEKIYNRLYDLLLRLDLIECRDTFINFSNLEQDKIRLCLTKLLDFFISTEEYVKCQILKNITDCLN